MTLRFRERLAPLAGAVILSLAPKFGALAEGRPPGGQVQIPPSSLEDPAKIGLSAHTNIRVFVPQGGLGAARPPSPAQKASPEQGPPFSGYLFETPASLACIYNLVAAPAAGCNPNTVTTNPTGGARTIAIVDAYHYPSALNDLQLFSTQFGLPLPTAANFQIVYATPNGQQPAVDADWNLEEALDIEWAHAMAPQARIFLVEANSNDFSDLLPAVFVAGNLVRATGGGEVSMSWGGSEFQSETSLDAVFSQSGVVYFAAAGDGPGVIWPSASPNVVSVGGTSVSRNSATGAFQREVAWQSGGGGPSLYEARPSFQNAISSIVATQRGTPDVAADADPSSGVWVFDNGAWYIIGGTSSAAPVWAGIVNAAASFAAGSATELTTVYTNSGNASDVRDIVAGTCGPNEGYDATVGWDFCTGVGSPQGYAGK
jgi:kumamolisin